MYPKAETVIIFGMGSVKEKWHKIIIQSLTGWAHTQNDPCGMGS